MAQYLAIHQSHVSTIAGADPDREAADRGTGLDINPFGIQVIALGRNVDRRPRAVIDHGVARMQAHRITASRIGEINLAVLSSSRLDRHSHEGHRKKARQRRADQSLHETTYHICVAGSSRQCPQLTANGRRKQEEPR